MGYNIESGGSGHSGHRNVNIEFLLDNNNEIIDTKTKQIYKNEEDWMRKTKVSLDDQYELFYNKDFQFQFLHPKKVKFYGQCIPRDASVYDILNERAIPYISIGEASEEELALWDLEFKLFLKKS